MQSVSIRGVTESTRVNVDSIDGALRTIDVLQSKVNQGIIYDASYLFGSIANSASAVMLVRGHTVSPYMIFRISSDVSNCYLTINERVSITGSGTTLTPINRHRGGVSPATGVSIFEQPTIASYSGVTLLATQFNKTYREDDRWVLRGGTTYAIAARNISGRVQKMSMRLIWLEQ